MNSTILNTTQTAICKLAKETYVLKQVSFLDERINFISKLKKEIVHLINIYENNKITEAKYSRAANQFHQNVKKLIGKEKLNIKPIIFEKEYSEFIFENEKLLNLKYKIDKNNLNANSIKFKLFGKYNRKYLERIKKINNKNVNFFYFNHKLNSMIYDEINQQNNVIGKNYLNLYKAILLFNNRYHSKIFKNVSKKNEQETSVKVNDISTEIEQVLINIKQLKGNLESGITEKIDELVQNYQTSFNEIENTNKVLSEFSEKNINNKKLSFHSRNIIENKKQNDFYKGLFGNWNFFEDISVINYFVLYEFFETRNNLNVKLHDEILSEFNKIVDLFLSMKNELAENKDSNNFISYLQNQKNSIKHRLEDDLLIQIVRLLPYDNPAPLIKSYLGKVKSVIGKLPEQRTITNLTDLDYNSNTNLHTFSSKGIIKNNIFNSAFGNLTVLSKTARTNVKKISAEVLGLGQISDYNFETAISVAASSIETRESLDDNSALKIAIEGIDRIIDKCNDVSNQLTEISNSAFEEFYSSVKKFTENLYKLNNSEELIKLKHKLSREKAKEEARQKIEKARTNVKTFFPLIIANIKGIYSDIKKKLFTISEKVGLTSAPKEVSEEILDYIIETEKQINSLPFIYQRLFKNTPVNDKRFFIGREKELEKIHKAYNHWSDGKFAPMVVVSEKGAGASSLTNMAQKEFEQSLDVVHIRLRDTIYKRKDFLNLLATSLNIKDVVDFDDLIDKLKNNPTKQVIIIENIEDLFLRVVNGFEVIKKFAQIMSLTNNNIFWIATCNKYAWNYLSKVINIDDYFAFIIRFDRFTNENIKEIIMTRHSMSGYKLKFIPSENNLEDKQYLKLKEQQKQKYLLESFFDELNKISQSNVALAQLFWLRSISELIDNEIHISSLHNIDFSFLKSLNRQKVFSLAALLIHDGLTVKEHAMVFNFSKEESRLLLSAMLDDGELRKTNGNYRVNFLLYVHIIKLLKNQNILH